MKKNPQKKQLFLENTALTYIFAPKMLRWVNTTSVKMQMGGKFLSPVCFWGKAIFTVLILVTLLSCEEDKNAKLFIPYKGPLEEAEAIEVLYSEAAQLKVRVTTSKQIKLPSEDKIFPKPVMVEFYGPNGQVLTTLRSDSARYDFKSGFYKVKGNVKVVNTQKQERLMSDELTWDPNTQKIYTDKAVTIESLSSGERINGLGLDANQDFTQYSVRKPTGFFNAPAGISP